MAAVLFVLILVVGSPSGEVRVFTEIFDSELSCHANGREQSSRFNKAGSNYYGDYFCFSTEGLNVGKAS